MSTLIILEDGRIWGCSNRIYDYLIERAVKAIEKSEGALPGLTDWLLEQRCEVQGPGVGSIDTRRMSPTAQQQFRDACEKALQAESRLDGRDGLDPSEFRTWLDHFRLLKKMWESMDRGDPPEALTSPRWKLHAPDPGKVGPGW